jgi:ribose 5-phosphate isomerase B
MINPVSDSEVKEIVHRVVQRTLGIQPPTVTQPVATGNPNPSQVQSQTVPPVKPVVAIGSDHGGFSMKESLKAYLLELGYDVVDCGTKDKNAVDYPDFAHSVAQLINQGKVWRGIVVDGAGIGSCMTANKVPGVRAAMCYDHATAMNSREHNNANLLTLGAGMIGDNLARQIVKTWLTTEFAGGRHAKRVDKIIEIEKKYLKAGN